MEGVQPSAAAKPPDFLNRIRHVRATLANPDKFPHRFYAFLAIAGIPVANRLAHKFGYRRPPGAGARPAALK